MHRRIRIALPLSQLILFEFPSYSGLRWSTLNFAVSGASCYSSEVLTASASFYLIWVSLCFIGHPVVDALLPFVPQVASQCTVHFTETRNLDVAFCDSNNQTACQSIA
jgi:hypothetical protein